jgi:hypothetical protein
MTSPLPWRERKASLPVMPGSLEEAIPRLRKLLLLTDGAGGHLNQTVTWPDDEQATTLREGLHGLGRCGLIRRIDRDTVELTASAKAWIADGDELQLVRVLHESVQFIGELLFVISESTSGLTHEEIRGVAVDTYRIAWKNIQQARKWTSWLRAAGCVFLRFDGKVEITDTGRKLLSELAVATPDDVNGSDVLALKSSGMLTKPVGLIEVLIDELDDVKLRNRAFGYGYIPRPMGSTIPATMRALMAIVGGKVERSKFIAECSKAFTLGDALAPRPLATLIALGLVIQTDATTYSLTELAEDWLESGSDLDLVRIFHAKIAVVGELLDAVEHHDKAPALSRYATKQYGFRHDVDGVRIRLHLLTAAGLLEQYALGRFRITRLGAAFRENLPRLKASDPDWTGVHSELSDKLEDNHPQSAAVRPVSTFTSAPDAIADELTKAALDSTHSERLEAAICNAFRYLGFDAELLGGPGRTDVLISFSTSPGKTVVVAVDAKSASSGVVAEGSVNFATIGEHKKLHNAAHSCIIGPSFHQSRLPRWAKEQEVALLNTDILALAVRKQDSASLGTRELATIFDPNEDPERSLMQAWSKAERKSLLFSSVIVALSREAQGADNITKGSLSLDNLYFLLRSDLESRPDPTEIEQAVSLLTSSLIESATRESGNYVITERPVTIARKLRALALAVEKAADLA